MRTTFAVVTVAALAAVGVWAAARELGQAARPSGAAPVVVVAELFTSEGCSSCPPADDLLAELLRTQPVPGVTLVGLSEHVDYWDRLGWRDPFSSPRFTERQTEYDGRVSGGGRIYTPQIVVDGRVEVLGSDRAAVLRAIAAAAREPRAGVTLTVTPSGSRVHVAVAASAPPGLEWREPADLLVAIVEDGLVTSVKRGENQGRTLQHSAVTRRLDRAGTWKTASTPLDVSTTLRLDDDWNPARLRVVALLQERQRRRIVGAAAAPLQGG
jgi:hypothetical protein